MLEGTCGTKKNIPDRKSFKYVHELRGYFRDLLRVTEVRAKFALVGMEKTVKELDRNFEIAATLNAVNKIKCAGERPEKMDYLPNFVQMHLKNF